MALRIYLKDGAHRLLIYLNIAEVSLKMIEEGGFDCWKTMW